jgi:hypothetical protein
MALPYHTSHAVFRIRSSRTPSDQWQCETEIPCTCGEGIISSHHYLLDCKHLILERDKLQRSVGDRFTMQSLFMDETGVMALLDFMKHTGFRYSKMVRCRSTPLEKDQEKIDEGQSELGFDTFHG